MLLINPPSGPILRKAACPASVDVRDVVYISADVSGGLYQADTLDISVATLPGVFGLVKSKPTATTCVVQLNGLLSGFTGLTPGRSYMVDASGKLTLSKPGAGLWVLHVAVATSSGEVLVAPRLAMKQRA